MTKHKERHMPTYREMREELGSPSFRRFYIHARNNALTGLYAFAPACTQRAVIYEEMVKLYDRHNKFLERVGRIERGCE